MCQKCRCPDPVLTCVNHKEMIDPGLWSNLSEDLVELVFARLPVPRIIELKNNSSAWSSLSDSSKFKLNFAEANPNLFGLLEWDKNLRTLWTQMFDTKSKEWHSVKLNFLLDKGYRNLWSACDGGLVCFVPDIRRDAGPFPVYVCNPVTNVWKVLPDLLLSKKQPMLLQLVVDVDANSYKVFFVYHMKTKEYDFGVDAYDSQTGSWGTMDSGLVFGSQDALFDRRFQSLSEAHMVFDCTTKELYYFARPPPLKDLKIVRCSILKDCLFVLYAPVETSTQVHTFEMFMISEYEYQSSTTDKLNDYKGTLRGMQIGSYVGRPDMELFTSNGFIFLTWHNIDKIGRCSQQIKLYDMAADEWHNLPTLETFAIQKRKLKHVFMCELRWNAVP